MKRMVHLVGGAFLGAGLTACVFAVSAAKVSPPQDPVKLSPQYYKVLLENDKVRVLEYRLRPGGKELMHSHPGGILHGFNETKLRSTLPGGEVTESSGKPGDVFWRDPVTHALENIGETEVHSLAVEVKSPCKQ